MHYVRYSWVLMIFHSSLSDFLDKTLFCKPEKHSHLVLPTKKKIFLKNRIASKMIKESKYLTDIFLLSYNKLWQNFKICKFCGHWAKCKIFNYKWRVFFFTVDKINFKTSQANQIICQVCWVCNVLDFDVLFHMQNKFYFEISETRKDFFDFFSFNNY